jgi:hypothetical protein
VKGSPTNFFRVPGVVPCGVCLLCKNEDMPKAIVTDWEMIKVRYVTGSLPKDLAAEFGVSIVAIKKRAGRGNWIRLRTATKSNVSTMVEKALTTFPEKSKRVKEGLADELVRQTETLERVPSKKTIKDLSARAALASTVAQTAGQTFGWNKSGDALSLVNVQFLSQAVVSRPVEPSQPVIDVPEQASAKQVMDVEPDSPSESV